MRYLIVGGSVAAVGAIEGIRKIDRWGQIMIITNEANPYYSRPLISYHLGGKIDENRLYYRDQEFYQKSGVEVVIGQVMALDCDHATVSLADGRSYSYNRLLLAVGGKPVLIDRLGQGRENVYGFYTLEDVIGIRDQIKNNPHAVVIGAGLVGLKVAEALWHNQVAVTVVDMAESLLPATLDQEAGAMVREHLEGLGIKFHLGVEVQALQGSPQVNEVLLSDGTRIPCGLVVVAAGTRPDLTLATGTSIAVNQGILVNERQQTSVENVYAAGDVAEGMQAWQEGHRVTPILPVAFEQGVIAGMNMAGGEATYRGALVMNSTSLMGMAVMSAGASKLDGIRTMGSQSGYRYYRKIVLEEGVPAGFIAVNNVENMGIITHLMRKRISVAGMEKHLLKPQIMGIDFTRFLDAGEGGEISCT